MKAEGRKNGGEVRKPTIIIKLCSGSTTSRRVINEVLQLREHSSLRSFFAIS